MNFILRGIIRKFTIFTVFRFQIFLSKLKLLHEASYEYLLFNIDSVGRSSMYFIMSINETKLKTRSCYLQPEQFCGFISPGKLEPYQKVSFSIA